MWKVSGLIWVVLMLMTVIEGHKFLLVFPLITPSHDILGRGFVRQLLTKGHEVVYVTAFPKSETFPNYTQVDVSYVLDTIPPFDTHTSDILEGKKIYINFQDMLALMEKLTVQLLSHDKLQNFLLDKNQSFDAVVSEWYQMDLMAGLSTIFRCPLVWFSSVDIHTGISQLVDDVMHPGYTTTATAAHVPRRSFLERAMALWKFMSDTYRAESARYKAAETYKQIYGEAATKRGIQLPEYEDVIYNASLLLINSHHSISSSIRLPQNVKAIGGYHIEIPTKPLPDNLQKLMDESKEGVIYFSLGSMMKSKSIPNEVKSELIKMFSQLKQTVLWKLEEDFPDLPKNVHIQKWMPQPSILAHPNTKLFITHGGLLSTTEAVHFGVPIVGIPLFADQFINMERAQSMGFSTTVRFSLNIANDLKHTIEHMFSNKSYAETMKKLSSLYHDRPIPPSEELSYWLEYVVRTQGAPHLRSPALLLTWYQRLYLDVLAALSACACFIAYFVWILLRYFNLKKFRKEKEN